jgi:2-haloacid dehalogenase
MSAPKALLFDVFGTVVDWRASIARECRALAEAKGLDLDGTAFADAWRAGYRPAMARVRSGELPWMNIDALHRMILDDILSRFGIHTLDESEKDHLNRAWHRLKPWPDAVRGLKELKQNHIIATLSNGNVALLTNMAKHAGLPWDCIFSAELFRHYKPDPETYLGAAGLLGLRAAEAMLVAAHPDDLVAARKAGLRTAYVHRPREFGARREQPMPEEAFDFVARDFVDLARQLDAA